MSQIQAELTSRQNFSDTCGERIVSPRTKTGDMMRIFIGAGPRPALTQSDNDISRKMQGAMILHHIRSYDRYMIKIEDVVIDRRSSLDTLWLVIVLVLLRLVLGCMTI